MAESGDEYFPYKVTLSNLTQDYLYFLHNTENQTLWILTGSSITADASILGDCAMEAIRASDAGTSFLLSYSKAHPITISDAGPALPQQEVSWTLDQITWTYGGTNTAQNTAYNDTADGGALTYSSSDPSVATVDADGKATIVGAGTATITATAAAVPGEYAQTSASYTLIINKAPLTITANDASLSYGAAPGSTGWTGSGYVYGEDASVVTGTPVYSYTYEQYGKAGTYEVRVSGLSSQNYEITYVPGVLTVEKAADYTITLDKLEQLAGHVSGVTAQISPMTGRRRSPWNTRRTAAGPPRSPRPRGNTRSVPRWSPARISSLSRTATQPGRSPSKPGPLWWRGTPPSPWVRL